MPKLKIYGNYSSQCLLNVYYKMLTRLLACIVLFMLYVNNGQPIYAQTSIDVYNQAIDDINCATTKKLLRSFDRQGTARKIKTCKSDIIRSAVSAVKENRLKGYRDKILTAGKDIDRYKRRLENPEDYNNFEAGLVGAGETALMHLQSICREYVGQSTTVCLNLEQKLVDLQKDINLINRKALNAIRPFTYVSDADATRPIKEVQLPSVNGPRQVFAPPQPTNTTVTAIQPAEATEGTSIVSSENNDNIEAHTNTAAAEPQQNMYAQNTEGNSIWITLLVFMNLFLLGAFIWLLLQHKHLKKELHTLHVLIQTLRRRDTGV